MFKMDEDSISREIEIAGRTNATVQPMEKFLRQLGTRAPFDTGLLPPGLRFYAQTGNHAQMLIELPPSINKISWGDFEGDTAFKIYELAQPYRIIIADLIDGELFGARIFYSPRPIAHLDDPLYHTNLANVNCKGYMGGVGVGWLCLYPTDNMSGHSLSEKIKRIIERCSGSETFNDANMSETDGLRFYSEHKKPNYTHSLLEWEKKSQAEGVEWTLDEDLWIPVLVANEDDQLSHQADGVPLTVRMALNGTYNAYYNDDHHPKMTLALRKGTALPANRLFQETITKSFLGVGDDVPMLPIEGHAEPVTVIPSGGCVNCGERYNNLHETSDGDVCIYCIESDYAECALCSTQVRVDTLTDNDLCESCGADHAQCSQCLDHELREFTSEDPDGMIFCRPCLRANLETCEKCDKEFWKQEVSSEGSCTGCSDQLQLEIG